MLGREGLERRREGSEVVSFNFNENGWKALL